MAYEIWTFYAIGASVTVIRLATRSKVLGVFGLQADDYLAFLALLFWTAMCYCDHVGTVVSRKMSPVLYSLFYNNEPLVRDEVLQRIPAVQIELMTDLFKSNYASWALKAPLLWSLKTCLVIFYFRLTKNLDYMRRLTVATAIILVLTFIAAEGRLLWSCVPTSDQWDMFSPNFRHCSLNNIADTRIGRVNLLIIGLTNISTDILLILIPLPLIWQVRVSMTKRLLTGFVLMSGIFIVVMATIRMAFGIMLYAAEGERANYLRREAFGWTVRENFTAVVVVNAVLIKPFFSSPAWRQFYLRVTGRSLSSSSPSDCSPDSGTKGDSGGAFAAFRRRVRDPWAITTAGATQDTRANDNALTQVDTASTEANTALTTVKSDNVEGGTHSYASEKPLQDQESLSSNETKKGLRDDVVQILSLK